MQSFTDGPLGLMIKRFRVGANDPNPAFLPPYIAPHKPTKSSISKKIAQRAILSPFGIFFNPCGTQNGSITASAGHFSSSSLPRSKIRGCGLDSREVYLPH